MNHRLILDESVSFDDLLTFAKNKYPNAVRKGKNLNLTDEITLGGDRNKSSFLIKVPRQRGISSDSVDRYGLQQVFGAEVPTGVEGEALAFALSVVRRSGGKLVTDSGVELTPNHFTLPDVQIVSPYELSPQQLLEVVQELIKETRIIENSADAASYTLELPLFGDSKIQVEVERLNTEIPAISQVEWVRAGAVSYRVEYIPGASSADPNNHDAHKAEIREAYLGCSAVAKSIHRVVGGFVLDTEGFLISENDLF